MRCASFTFQGILSPAFMPPCGAKIWSSQREPGDPKVMNELLSLARFHFGNTAQVQRVDRQHRQPLEIIYVIVPYTTRDIQVAGQEQEGNLQSPMCTTKYICKWRITAHGSPTKQSRFRLEQWRRRCKAITAVRSTVLYSCDCAVPWTHIDTEIIYLGVTIISSEWRLKRALEKKNSLFH